MDILDVWTALRPALAPVSVWAPRSTVFETESALADRVRKLVGAGMDGVVFVANRTGPRSRHAGAHATGGAHPLPGPGRARGVVLMPQTPGELDRFETSARTRDVRAHPKLYSDRIVGFRPRLRRPLRTPPGDFVVVRASSPASRGGSPLDWLLHDERQTPTWHRSSIRRAPRREVTAAAPAPTSWTSTVGSSTRRRPRFPLSVHLEAPYGLSDSACETFSALLTTGRRCRRCDRDPPLDSSRRGPRPHLASQNRSACCRCPMVSFDEYGAVLEVDARPDLLQQNGFPARRGARLCRRQRAHLRGRDGPRPGVLTGGMTIEYVRPAQGRTLRATARVTDAGAAAQCARAASR